MNDESETIATIQAMRQAIHKKGDHSLFDNAAGTLMYHVVGSRSEREMEKMRAYKLIGVYSSTAQLSDILRDVGA